MTALPETGPWVRLQPHPDVFEYRGIPFAKPAEGEARFSAPRPLAEAEGTASDVAGGWGPQTLQEDASTSRGSLLSANQQLHDDTFGLYYDQPGGGDTLRLHVWAPDRSGEGRPVMVWLHGGGFEYGTAASQRTSGVSLAASHDVVVVAISHRLGAPGYLYLGELDASKRSDANAGMQDIVLGLQWVRDNIARFGGDAANVTLFGESGGGMKIATLMAMPSAHGLFHKAILQSAPVGAAQSPADATRAAKVYLEVAGVDIAGLATLSDDEVVAAQIAADSIIRSTEVGSGAQSFVPVLDGTIITDDPINAISTGWGATVPVMSGTTSDEWLSFLRSQIDPATFDDVELLRRVETIYGTRAASELERYRALFPTSDLVWLWSKLFSDRLFAAAHLRMVQGRRNALADTWEYLTTHIVPRAAEYGSFHCLDAAYMFDTIDILPIYNGDPDARALTDAICSTWASFARTGRPDVPGVDWVPSRDETHPTLVLDLPLRMQNAPLNHVLVDLD